VSGKAKKLGKAQRQLLIAAELYRRQHGQAPLWRELREQLELRPAALGLRMQALRQQGLITYTEEPRSLRVTAEGLAAAVNGRPRP
jgi:hypothetical protein